MGLIQIFCIHNELAELQKEEATLADGFNRVCKGTDVDMLKGDMFL